MLCDISQVPEPAPRIRLRWRILLGLAAILFWLTNGLLVRGGYYAYHGYSADRIARIAPVSDSGIEIEGPLDFVQRTELVLGLLKLRSPSYYFRVQQSVTSITYLAPNYLSTAEGRRISLEDIGALAHPATGAVSILYSTAFPRGPGDIADYDIFSYAGVLVHELRHIELYASGQDLGGWEEEKLCEEAAYDCLKFMDAPGGVLARYDMYLYDPQHSRYQRWYDWYMQ